MCRYHNRKTEQQYDDCAQSTFNKSRKTVFAELFAIELKLVCDTLKRWFSTQKKQVEIDEVEKFNFLMNNTPQNCCICDFPIDPFSDSGWFSHVCSAEYLFLQNIYSERDLARINIASLEEFVAKVKKMLDCLPAFCDSIEFENFKSMRHLGNIDEDLDGLLTEIHAAATNTFQTEQEKGKLSKKQVLGYLYKTSNRHRKNANINVDASYTDNFLSNLAGIAKHKLVVHHSHVSSQIIGFAHRFCNLKVKENYYVIPVIAHNQFRFNFFFFM